MGCVVGTYYLARPGKSAFFEPIVDLIGIFYPVGLALLCFCGSNRFAWPWLVRPTRRDSRRFSPALLGMALLCFALAESVRSWMTLVMHIQFAFPSPEHFTFIAMYPFFICAILALPSQHLSLISRLRIVLDSLIVMVAVTTLCYYYLLAPVLFRGGGTVLEKVFASAFIQADLVFMFCLLMVALRFGDAVLRPVLIMLGLAILCLFTTHAIHLDELLLVGYKQFSPGNALLFLCGMFIVGAAQTVRRIVNRGESEVTLAPERSEQASLLYPAERWKALLPSILVLIFGLLIFGIWLTGSDKHFSGQIALIYIGAFVVLLLMVLRQFLATYEIGRLQRELQARNLSLRLVNAQLEQLVTTDPLTGLSNHRTVVRHLNEELARARASYTPCSLLFIDIDYFKTINDRYGHPAGDTVLRQFSELLRSTLQPFSILGRWGGEEFMAVLPRVDATEALSIAEHIRRRVAQQTFYCELCRGNLHLTCSLGIATYPDNAIDAEGLIACSDLAMYAAKRLGRNQVRAAHEPGVLAVSMDTDISVRLAETAALHVVEALLALQEERDPYTSQHERRVSGLATELALTLGLSSAQASIVRLGGLLHDLGKVALPDTLLLKQGRLDENEFGAIRQHPVTGAEVLSTVPALSEVASVVRSHHERLNGSGYPDGLQGDAIPLGARIVAVADAYDVITHSRPYHHARSPNEALDELRQGAGVQFDARVVDALVQFLATTPRRSVVDVA